MHEAHCHVLQVMLSDPVCLFGLLKDEEFTASSAATLGLPTVDGVWVDWWLCVGGLVAVCVWIGGCVWVDWWLCVGGLMAVCGWIGGCVWVCGTTFSSVCPFYSCRHALPVCGCNAQTGRPDDGVRLCGKETQVCKPIRPPPFLASPPPPP